MKSAMKYLSKLALAFGRRDLIFFFVNWKVHSVRIPKLDHFIHVES